MKKLILIKNSKAKAKKTGYIGNEIWKAHRLEGVVENKGIKPIKKKKQIKVKPITLDKAHNPDKIAKKKVIVPDFYYN